MQLFTVLGAAAANTKFRNLLFSDPVKAAGLLDITLTPEQLNLVRSAFSRQNQNQLSAHLDAVATMICNHPPCPAIPVISGLDAISTTAA